MAFKARPFPHTRQIEASAFFPPNGSVGSGLPNVARTLQAGATVPFPAEFNGIISIRCYGVSLSLDKDPYENNSRSSCNPSFPQIHPSRPTLRLFTTIESNRRRGADECTLVKSRNVFGQTHATPRSCQHAGRRKLLPSLCQTLGCLNSPHRR